MAATNDFPPCGSCNLPKRLRLYISSALNLSFHTLNGSGILGALRLVLKKSGIPAQVSWNTLGVWRWHVGSPTIGDQNVGKVTAGLFNDCSSQVQPPRPFNQDIRPAISILVLPDQPNCQLNTTEQPQSTPCGENVPQKASFEFLIDKPVR